LNFELYTARRLFTDDSGNKKISKPIVNIAIVGISLGLIVMILSVSIVTGFKKEIRNKIIGFGSHIQIVNYDSNISYETTPVMKNQPFYPSLDTIEGVKHIQVYAIKAGILKTKENIQGAVIKGIDKDFNWSFFEKNLVKGSTFSVTDSIKKNDILISKYMSDLLKLDTGDRIIMYFIEDPPRARPFNITGIFNTGLQEYDEKIILGDIKHVQKLNNWNENQVSGFEVLTDEFQNIRQVTSYIRNKYTYELFSDSTSEKLRVIPITQKNPQIFNWLDVIDINVWIILTLVIAVAGFNMISGLLIIILERTNMIGIFKSMGASNWSIRKTFLYLSSLLIGKGMLWGNIIGILICIIQYHFGIIKLDPATYYIDTVPINLNLMHIVFLNIGSILAIVLMLIVPSYIISRISPVKTIRFN